MFLNHDSYYLSIENAGFKNPKIYYDLSCSQGSGACFDSNELDFNTLLKDVIVPSSFPFILTAMRLGVGAALTTLVAAELTGTTYGLGAMIQSQASNLNFGVAIMGIIILGVFGIILDKILLFAEKKLTKWK